jgi:hypothetical protein
VDSIYSAYIIKIDNTKIYDKGPTGNFGSVNFVHPKSVHGVQIEVLNPDS